MLIGTIGLGLGVPVSDRDLQAAYGAAAVPAVLALENAMSDAFTPVGIGLPDGPVDAIRLEGVSFRYAGTDRDVLTEIDLEIPAGQRLAVVGMNGAGKTTLIKLLARLYEPAAGRITVDGRDLATIDPASWRRRLAVLFQDYVRYELPATDNVGFGAPALLGDDERLERAAIRAGAEDIIGSLDKGWDTTLSRQRTEGADLSGGQWQRVALARALLAVDAGARVLILDEPTANLDVRAEADVYNWLLDLDEASVVDGGGRLTTILISHRFSTVRRADRIVVVEHGRIVEDGSHDELLVLGGRYAAMFRAQASRFQDEGHIDLESPEPADA